MLKPKMHFVFALSLALYFFSSTATASLIDGNLGSQKIEDVPLLEKATLNYQNSKLPLKRVSAGLRIKKVVFYKAKVYVAEWLISESASWTNTIENLKSLGPVSMRLTFLRNIEAEKIEAAFREALAHNKISLDSESVKKFLQAVSDNGSIKEKQTMTVTGIFNSDNSETLLFESSQGKLSEIKAETGFLQKIFSIWFGENTETEMTDLKKSLLGQK